jgi:hypothetical protein
LFVSGADRSHEVEVLVSPDRSGAIDVCLFDPKGSALLGQIFIEVNAHGDLTATLTNGDRDELLGVHTFCELAGRKSGLPGVKPLPNGVVNGPKVTLKNGKPTVASVGNNNGAAAAPAVADGPVKLRASFMPSPQAMGLALLDFSARVSIPRGVWKIGREDAAPIVLVDPSVSAYHGQFAYDGTRLTYQDLSSKNGSFLNGQALRPHLITMVKVSDVLRLGAAEVRVIPPQPEPELLDKETGETLRKMRDAARSANTMRFEPAK